MKNPFHLPERYAVNSTDYLLLLFHKDLLKDGKCGNVVRTVIFSDSVFPPDKIRDSLKKNELLKWINSYRIENGFWNSPRFWVIGETPIEIEFEEVISTMDEIPDSILNKNLNTDGKGLIYIHCVVFPKGGSALIISVNHCFTDFKGVESLVEIILSNFTPSLNAGWVSTADNSPSFIPKLLKSLSVVGFMLRTMGGKFIIIGNRKAATESKSGKNVFRILNFSEPETAQIESEINKLGLTIQPNVFFLGKTILAFQNTSLLSNRGLLWISVPVNARKKGVIGQFLGNSLQFLFYRIQVGEQFSFTQLLIELKEQTLTQLRQEIPKKYTIMATWWKKLPLPIYEGFVKMPTKGVVSSLSFSNLGNTFQGLDKVFGCEVKSVVSLPSNPSPPGIGVVVMKNTNCYSLVLVSENGLICENQFQKLASELGQLVLNKASNES